MQRGDLEPLIDASLKALPAPQAPATLVPRVMAAISALRGQPWYLRPWLSWPAGWQAASATVVVSMLAGALWMVPAATGSATVLASAAAAHLPDGVASSASQVVTSGERAAAAATALGVIWRVVFAPFVLYASALVVLMCLTCAAFAAMLTRVACRKVVPQ